MKGYAREKMQEITADRSALRKCRNAVSAGVLSPISSAVGRNGAVGDKRNARAGARNSPCAGCGRDEGVLRRCAATPHPPPSGAPSPQGEGLRVRHSHRGPLKGKTNGGVLFNTANPQGEGLGDKKKRPGALLLALFISFCLFISFWRCRSGPSGTGATGRRRGLRRGRRSWGPRWAAPRAGRSSNSRRRREPPPTWP